MRLPSPAVAARFRRHLAPALGVLAVTVVLALVAGLVLLPAAAAGQSRQAAYAAAARAGASVVLVEYVLAREGHGFGAAGQRTDMAALGVLAGDGSLIVLSGSIFPEEEDESRTPARPHEFRVRLPDGRRLPAELLGRAEDVPLAFLQLPAPAGPPLRFATGAALAAGDQVLYLSLLPEKYGFQPTVHQATIGAVLASPHLACDLDAFIQDASIGSPALDLRGRVVGLLASDPFGQSSAGSLNAPLKYVGAIQRGKAPGMPVLLPAASFAALLADPPREAARRPHRAWLGVTLQPVDRALADYWSLAPPHGVLVTSVWPGSPSDAAGLRAEDRIVRFDAADVQVPNDEALRTFIETVQAAGPGRRVRLDVHRDGAAMAVEVELGIAPDTAVRTAEYRSAAFGLAAQDLTIDIILARGWPDNATGAIISELETAGWAQVGGLSVGDLVLGVDGKPVAGIVELAAALDAAETARARDVVFFVLRDPDTLFVRVRTDW